MPTDIGRTERRLRELAFLHEIAQLATPAWDWDVLIRAIVDGTTTVSDPEEAVPAG